MRKQKNNQRKQTATGRRFTRRSRCDAAFSKLVAKIHRSSKIYIKVY